jgi:hypothetical protein
MNKLLIALLPAVSLLTALAAFPGCITIVLGPENKIATQSGDGKPDIVYFNATPADISAGGRTTISWKVTGASDIKIVPEIGPAGPEAAITVYPDKTTTYTLTASNQVGSTTKVVVVTIPGDQSGQSQSGQTGVSNPLPGDQSGQSQSAKTVTLKLLLAESGSLIKNSTAYTRYSAVCAGDNIANLPSRAFLSFDLSSLPPGATIKEAVLDLSDYTVIGNPTYSASNWGNMGAMEVYQYQYGSFDGLGRLGYDATVPVSGSLRLTELTGMPLKVEVTNNSSGINVIQKLLADGQTRCQFRVQFFTTTNWDGKADMVCMDSAVLRVTYQGQ